MNEMKIDLRVIRGWVEKWQEDDGVTQDRLEACCRDAERSPAGKRKAPDHD